jgi:hypothetical protein
VKLLAGTSLHEGTVYMVFELCTTNMEDFVLETVGSRGKVGCTTT